jgi:esterase/lipase superfamily enzyme
MVFARYFFALMLGSLLVAGCSGPRELMPTPNLYADETAPLFGELDPELTRTQVELIYVTDRAPETDEAGNLAYGFNRSASLAAGTTVVDLGQNATWDELVAASLSPTRLSAFELRTVSIDEFARLPPTPIPYEVVDGQVVEDPDAVAKQDAVMGRMRAELLRRLDLTPRKDVFIYIHGYHNTFEDAAFALAELWHFFGREALPIIYTWPAGYPASSATPTTGNRASSRFST